MGIRLADVFEGIAFKRLRPTEVDPDVSHGHEFQGVSSFRDLFGSDRREFEAVFVYLDDESDPVSEEGELTWYDSRENQPRRSAEYRLYYSKELGIIQERAVPGDLVVVGLKPDGDVAVIVAKRNSTWEQQILWLFDIDVQDEQRSFRVEPRNELAEHDLGLVAQLLLDELGIEPPLELLVDEAAVYAKFPAGFPTTMELSRYARSISNEVSAIEDPDSTIVHWVTLEEQVFRVLEHRQWNLDVEKRNPCGDLEVFLEVSKSYQNRRKSRAGRALENQLEQVLVDNDVMFTRGGRTEGNRQPDFLFPSIDAYHNAAFDEAGLSMLGAKTSCKDRWRQVLDEAARIPNKHLVTLDPAVSEGQTTQMIESGLQLVVPSGLVGGYTQRQRDWLMTVGDFIGLVKSQQERFTP